MQLVIRESSSMLHPAWTNGSLEATRDTSGHTLWGDLQPRELVQSLRARRPWHAGKQNCRPRMPLSHDRVSWTANWSWACRPQKFEQIHRLNLRLSRWWLKSRCSGVVTCRLHPQDRWWPSSRCYPSIEALRETTRNLSQIGRCLYNMRQNDGEASSWNSVRA
jgi:hypothetical protein